MWIWLYGRVFLSTLLSFRLLKSYNVSTKTIIISHKNEVGDRVTNNKKGNNRNVKDEKTLQVAHMLKLTNFLLLEVACDKWECCCPFQMENIATTAYVSLFVNLFFL